MKAIIRLAIVLIVTNFATAEAGVLPNSAVVDGRTVGEWTAEWWKWIYAQPTNQLPLLDVDGSLAANGQRGGSVFFVANIAAPGTVTRSFTVPEGSYLLFPVRYVTLDNVDFPAPLSLEQLRDTAAGVVDLMTNLHASVDGQAIDVSAHRVQSPVFSFDFQTDDNLDSFIYGHPVSGLVDPIVSDGYWIMVEPLALGTHTISFGGEIGPPFSSSKEIVDTITVVATRLSTQVEALIEALNAAGLPSNRPHPLVVSLQAAAENFDSGDNRAGINQMRAFQNKVRAQVERRDRVLADELSQAAQQIIDKAASQLQ